MTTVSVLCVVAEAPALRATPTTTPDNERGVAVDFATEAERDRFVSELEEHFAAKRFTNAADAFDTVKAYVTEHLNKK